MISKTEHSTPLQLSKATMQQQPVAEYGSLLLSRPTYKARPGEGKVAQKGSQGAHSRHTLTAAAKQQHTLSRLRRTC